MSPLTGDRLQPAVHLAVDDDAAAAAGAHDHAEHDAVPSAGAGERFSEGEAVGVVLDRRLTPSRARRSCPTGIPFRQVVFEFLRRPVRRTAPGVPIRTVRRAVGRAIRRYSRSMPPITGS